MEPKHEFGKGVFETIDSEKQKQKKYMFHENVINNCMREYW